jgi:hypothetical protein
VTDECYQRASLTSFLIYYAHVSVLLRRLTQLALSWYFLDMNPG